MQLLEILRPLPLDDAVEDFSIKRRHEQNVEVIIAVGDERDSVSLRRQGRTRVVEVAVLRVVGQPAGVVGWILPLRHVGIVEHLLFLLPPFGKLLDVQADGRLESLIDAAGRADAIENLADLRLTVLRGDVVPHGLTASVREVTAEVFDRRKVVVYRGVAQEHIGIRIPAEGGVLTDALVEPEGEDERRTAGEEGLDGPAVEHVVDDRMDKFMVNDVAELAVAPLERNHHAVLEELGDTADALLQVLPDHVRLLEIVVGIVHDNRNPVRDLVPEEMTDGNVRAFRGFGGKHGQVIPPLRVVDVKVIALNELPGEPLILNLVLAEDGVLRFRDRRTERDQQQDKHEALHGDSRNFG